MMALLVVAYVLGFVAAIPIGATQIEIARRALADRLDAALMIVLGSVLSDTMYGALALFGLAPFLADRRVLGVFGLAGALVLAVLAVVSLRHVARARTRARTLDARRRTDFSRVRSFTLGFSLAVTNAPIAFWWLVGVKIGSDLGLVASALTPGQAAAFVLAGGCGIGSYLALLAIVLRRLKHMLSPEHERRAYLVLGGVLVVLAVYMLGSAVRDLRSGTASHVVGRRAT